MKRLFHIIIALSLSYAMASCYGIKDENFKELADIDIELETGEWIYTKQAQLLILNMRIESENGIEPLYEWAYGSIGADGFPSMRDTTFISDKKEIDYSFGKVGDFVLRLKADNGETIAFRYYRLRVATGVDEGIVILNEDDQGNGYLSFIKTRTQDEIDADEQEFWLDIMSEINPTYPLVNIKDMYLSYNTSANYKNASFIILAADENGSVMKMDPRTLQVAAYLKMEDIAAGVKPLKMVGEGTSAAYYAYIMGSDGNLYRYDLSGDVLGLRPDCAGLNIGYAYEFRNAAKRIYLFRAGNTMYVPGNGVVNTLDLGTDYDIINAGVRRTSTVRYHIVTKSKLDGKIYHFDYSSSLGGQHAGPSYEDTEICLDENSIMVSSRQSSLMFYNYNDRIYSWDVSDYANGKIQSSPIMLQPQIPDGEQITALGTNGDPNDTNSAEDLLYIATYNPSRNGETKGSLYIYNITNYTLVEVYEGIFHKPVKVFYKYPISV